MKKFGILLSGCGVYDGSEIHESVLTILAVEKNGGSWFCIAPDKNQHHVINHITGQEMQESRNVLIESARIARGNIQNIAQVNSESMDALILPGGFGVAKNFTDWAFNGADGTIDGEVKKLILDMIKAKKPVGAMCMAPTTIAKALEGSGIHPTLTIGNTTDKSPYDIAGIQVGMKKIGATPMETELEGVCVDKENKIVTTPCYMMEVGITTIANATDKLVKEIYKLF